MTDKEKRQAVLAICQKYVGTVEGPGSNNVFFNTRFYGVEVKDGFDLKGKPDKTKTYQWCFTSVSEIFIEAGFPLGNIGWKRGAAGVPYAMGKMKDWGTIIPYSNVQPGDIVLMDFKMDNKWDHVGILKSAGGVMEIYEGNTSSDDSGHQSNGGEYCLKRRAFKNINYMFVCPHAYDRDQNFKLKK